MKLEFSKEQVQFLYEIVGRAQITGNAAKTVVEIQTVIENAFQKEEETPKK